MHSEYFDAIVISKTEKNVTEKRKTGLFKYSLVTNKEYYIQASIKGTDFILEINVEEEVYKHAEKDEKLSVHLAFKYEFACFHFLPRNENTSKIIKVKN